MNDVPVTLTLKAEPVLVTGNSSWLMEGIFMLCCELVMFWEIGEAYALLWRRVNRFAQDYVVLFCLNVAMATCR